MNLLAFAFIAFQFTSTNRSEYLASSLVTKYEYLNDKIRTVIERI